MSAQKFDFNRRILGVSTLDPFPNHHSAFPVTLRLPSLFAQYLLLPCSRPAAAKSAAQPRIGFGFDGLM